MEWQGNLRKLLTAERLNEMGHVDYRLEGADVLDTLPALALNEWIGQQISIQFQGQINCRVTGQSIRKPYGEGMSYQAWTEHPAAVESVLRPELSRIHEGIALRDFEWEQMHHNQPHYVYVSQTGAFKVGVTRTTNRPFRWHDQGAVAAVAIAQTPYRQLAGEIEVALKEIVSDRTNYRKMLTEVQPDEAALEDWKEECFEHLGALYEPFFIDESPEAFQYPVLEYPFKVNSLTLDKAHSIDGTLQGIKGQYFLFDGGRVMNIRRHSGYRVRIVVG
jgi:hypothetical protein